MPSKLSVFNDALSMCAQPPIESDTTAGEDGDQCRAHWQNAIEIAHEKTAWDFAKLRAQLARSATTPTFQYKYYYTLPADLLRILYLSETGTSNAPLLDYEGEPGRIATDAETVYCTYVSTESLTQIGRWSASFAHYVATELAFRIAPKINSSALEAIDKERRKALSDAVGLDATQGPPVRRRPGSWSRAARGFTGRIDREQR